MENLNGSRWFVSGPTLEPPLPRRKKCPELAYKTHEFITAADGGGIDAVDSNVVADKVRVRASTLELLFFPSFFILLHIDYGNDNKRYILISFHYYRSMIMKKKKEWARDEKWNWKKNNLSFRDLYTCSLQDNLFKFFVNKLSSSSFLSAFLL